MFLCVCKCDSDFVSVSLLLVSCFFSFLTSLHAFCSCLFFAILSLQPLLVLSFRCLEFIRQQVKKHKQRKKKERKKKEEREIEGEKKSSR